jgi:hypothetical protein
MPHWNFRFNSVHSVSGVGAWCRCDLCDRSTHLHDDATICGVTYVDDTAQRSDSMTN